MKILIATPLYPPEIGGPATHTKMLEEELPKYGIQFETVPFQLVHKYPKIIRHLSYGYFLFKRARDVSFIYTLDGVSVGFPALVVSKLRRKPLVLRLGGDYAWEQGKQRFGVTRTLDDFTKEDKKQYAFFLRTLVWVQQRVAAYAFHIVLPSNYLASIVRQWPVDANKIKVISSSIDDLVLSYKPDVPDDSDTAKIVSAGRLVPWKGFADLIEAVTQLSDKSAKLVIVGEGPERTEIEKVLREKDIAKQVTLTGQMSKVELLRICADARAFVLNSSYEGLSHQLLEVMAIGIPVIATNVAGNAELVQDEVNGLLVPVGDTTSLKNALERLLTDEELRARIIKGGKETVQKFTPDAVMKEFLTLAHSYEKKY